MTGIDVVLLVAVVPFLLTLQLVIVIERHASHLEPEDFSGRDWVAILLASTLYPLTWFVILTDYIWPWLIKTRHWGKSEEQAEEVGDR